MPTPLPPSTPLALPSIPTYAPPSPRPSAPFSKSPAQRALFHPSFTLILLRILPIKLVPFTLPSLPPLPYLPFPTSPSPPPELKYPVPRNIPPRAISLLALELTRSAGRVLPTHAARLAYPRSASSRLASPLGASCLPAQRVLSTRSMCNIFSPPPSFGSSDFIVVREFRLIVVREFRLRSYLTPRASFLLSRFIVDNIVRNGLIDTIVRNGLVDVVVHKGLVANKAKTADEETSYIEARRELLEYMQDE
ncbi:hypothetical protein EV714DRAFT_277185 [Schizophyllum commune]